MAAARRRRGSWLRRAGDAVFGFLTVQTAARHPADQCRHHGECRRRHDAPHRPRGCRSTASAAPTSPRRFRRSQPPRSRRSCAASGTISAASAPSSPTSTGCGTTIPRTARPAASWIPTRPRRLRFGCATTASRRSSSPRIWRTGSSPRSARTPTASTPPCSIAGPNVAAISDAVIGMREGCMGTLIPTSTGAPQRLLEALQRGSHVAMLVDQYSVQGVPVTFFGRPTRRQLADRAARPPYRLPDPRHPRGALSRRPLPIADDRGARRAARRRAARSTSSAPCRRSPTWSKAGSASIPSSGCGCTAGGGISASPPASPRPEPIAVATRWTRFWALPAMSGLVQTAAGPKSPSLPGGQVRWV